MKPSYFAMRYLHRIGIKKVSSLITVFAFILNTLCLAPNVLASGPASMTQAAGMLSDFPGAFRGHAQPDLQFSIPADLGSVEFFKQGTGPTLIHIQTAHGHYAVQKQIQAILHFLDRTHGIKTLLVEGSAFELDPSGIRFFPEDNERSLKAADELAKRALVKGPELYLLDKMLGNEEAKAYGIEELTSYRDNGAAFVSVLDAKAKTRDFLSDMNLGIERLSSHYLDKDLRDFLNQEEAFQKNRVPLENWLTALKAAAARHLHIDLGDASFQIDWPMMVRMFKIRELSGNLDSRKLEAERAAFLREAERFLPPNDPLLGEIEKNLKSEQSGRALSNFETVGLFEEMVRRLPPDFPYDVYPNLKAVIGAHLLGAELRAPGLMREVDALTRKISESLVKTDTEKRLLQLVRDYRLLQKLFSLELLPEDYDTILSRQKGSAKAAGETGLMPSAIAARIENIQRGESKVSRVKDVSFGHVSELDGLYKKAVAFYGGVKERDVAMEKRIEERISQSGADKAVVITGGFHSRPFRDYFAGKDFSYALITPKLASPDPKGHEAYLSNMLRFTRADGGVTETSKATRESEFLSDPHVLSGGAYGVNVAAMRAEIKRIVQGTVGVMPSGEEIRAELRNAGEEKSTAELADEFRRMKAEGRLKDLPGILKLLFYSAGPATGKGTVLKKSFIAEDGEGIAPYQDLVEKFVIGHTRNYRPHEKEKDGRHYHFRPEGYWYALAKRLGPGYLDVRKINNQEQALPIKSFVDEGLAVDKVTGAGQLRAGDVVRSYEALPNAKSKPYIQLKNRKILNPFVVIPAELLHKVFNRTVSFLSTLLRWKGLLKIQSKLVRYFGVRTQLVVECSTENGPQEITIDSVLIDERDMGTFLPGDKVSKVEPTRVTVDRRIVGLEEMLQGNHFTIFEGGYDWFNWIKDNYPDALTLFLSPFEEADFPKRENNMKWMRETFSDHLDVYLAFEGIDQLIEGRKGWFKNKPALGELDITKHPALQQEASEMVRKGREKAASYAVQKENERVILDPAEFVFELEGVMARFIGKQRTLNEDERNLAVAVANELQHRLFGRDGVKPFLKDGKKTDAYNRILEGTFQILTRQNYGPENVLPNPRYADLAKRAESLAKLGDQFARKLFDYANTGVRQELRHEANYHKTTAFIRENRREKGIPEKKIPGFTPEKGVQYAQALIERKFVPAVDRLDVLRMLRAQASTRDGIIAFAVGDQDYRAFQAALEGADILFVDASIAEKVLREAKLKYPHVLVYPEASVEDLGFQRVVEDYARQRVDGIILKPYAKGGKVILDLVKVRELSEKYPNMTFVVAGGVRIENSREILALPSNVMVGAGFEMGTIDELRQNADLLVRQRAEIRREAERAEGLSGTREQERAELRDAEELLYHVDENDNVLGSIARSSIQQRGPKPIFRTVQVIAIAPTGELVFQERALIKKGFPGSMDFTSGHVIYGQDYAVSAAKEASEELPLTVAPEDLVRIVPSAQESFLKLRGEGTWQNRGVFILPVNSEQMETIRQKDRELRLFWDGLYSQLAAQSPEPMTVEEFKAKVKTDPRYKGIVQEELIRRVGADNLANYEIEGYSFMTWEEAVRRNFENVSSTPFADGVYGLFDAKRNPVKDIDIYRAATEKAIGETIARQRLQMPAPAEERDTLAEIIRLMAKRQTLPGKADMLIVFGGPDMAQVTQAAANLYREGRVSTILVSGRYKKEVVDAADGNYGTLDGKIVRPEAVVYQEQLVKLGVPAEAILIEDQSHNMKENAVKTVALLKQKGLYPKTVIFMHGPFHQLVGSKEARAALGIGVQVFDYAAYVPEVPSEEAGYASLKAKVIERAANLNSKATVAEVPEIERINALTEVLQRSELRSAYPRTFQVFDPRETDIDLVANTALNGIFEADFENNRGVIHRPDGKVEYAPSYGIGSKSPVENTWAELAAQLGTGTNGMSLLSYHNLYYLDWFVAFDGKSGRLLHGFGEPFEARTYSMFVRWNDGKVSSEDLRFKLKEGPDHVEVYRASDTGFKEPLGPQIRFAVFGQRLIRNGEAVPAENFAAQFFDVFHLYRFPELQSKDESEGKGKFSDWFVRQFKTGIDHPMVPQDRPLLWDALKNNGYVEIDLTGLLADYPLDEIKAKALDRRGYAEVPETEKGQLAEGEYYIKGNVLSIRLRPFPYPHDLIGITKSGKVVAIVLPGDKTKGQGYAIPRTKRTDVPQLQDVILQALPEDPIQDVFLLANSKDALVWRDGAVVSELSSAKNYSSAPAAITFLPKMRSELRSQEAVSPELSKLMAGAYLPQEIEALPLDLKTQLLRDLMAGVPGRDLSSYDLEEKMLLLSGAPGSGKDLGAMAFGGKGITVDGKTLTFKDLFGSLLLYHSRSPRAGEINGSKYHFGHTDVGNPEKNRILRLLTQTGDEGQTPIIEAYVNKQLQGVAVRRFIEKDLVLVNPGEEGSYDQILPTDENVRHNPDGTVTVDRPIVGLAEAFNANRLTYLEGGFHWFRQLIAKHPDIFTVFISSFSDEQLDLREKNQKILQETYPGNPLKIAAAWNLLNVMRATQRAEAIDLGEPQVFETVTRDVEAWMQNPLRTENPAEALKLLGRKPFDKNGAPLDSEAAVLRNAELIESPRFIEAVNHLLRDYFGLDFRIDETNAARARAVAYYVQKRLVESGRNDISADLEIPTVENEKAGDFSKAQDMLNRVVEGIAQAFLQDQYSTGDRQGKGLRIVNEFAYGVLLARDKDEIDRMINTLLTQHAEAIADTYFAYVLNAINAQNQSPEVRSQEPAANPRSELRDVPDSFSAEAILRQIPDSWQRLTRVFYAGMVPLDVYDFVMQSGRAAAVDVVAVLTGRPAYAEGVNSPAAEEKQAALTDRPETFKASPKFSVAGGVIGVRTGKVSDALILTPKFAFDRGAIAAVRTVFGDMPVAVVVRDAKDRAFMKDLNAKLVQANRPEILMAESAEDAIRIMEKQAAVSRNATKIKALVDASEKKDPLALALLERLPDTVIVTTEAFRSFMNYAGGEVAKLINSVQAQFAISRAA